MKKLLLAVAVITISAVTVNAQTNFSIAGSIGTGTSTGYKLAVGGDLQVDIPATTGLKITGSAVYQHWSYEVNLGAPYGTVKVNFGFIPILAGAKFNLTSSLYGHAQLGYSVSTESGGSGSFTYAPSLGYMVSPAFDIAVKYLALSSNGSTAGAILARLAYTFGKK